MKQLYLFFILFLAIIACQAKNTEKGSLHIVLHSYNNSDFDIVKKRLNKYCKKKPIFTEENNILRIEILNETDSNTIKYLITNKGNLSILETPSSHTIDSILSTINNILLNNNNLELNLLNSKPGFPIYNLLFTSNSNYSSDAVVGHCFIYDTNKINYVINHQLIKQTLPNTAFYWTVFDDERQIEKIIKLIATTLTNSYTPITSKMLANIEYYFNQQYGGNEVHFTLKPQYYKLWEDMTERNIGKTLAIIIDEKVYSYPRVHSKIKKGRAAVSVESEKQAKALTSILSFDQLKAPVTINHIEFIPRKK